MEEYLGFVLIQTVNGELADRRSIADEWRAANDHIRNLEEAEPGAADNPEVVDLPATLSNLASQVVMDPIFRQAFSLVPTRLAMVELDHLVVFQKHINLRFVRELVASLGTSPSPEEVLKFSLPLDHPVPPVQAGRTSPNSWAFVSPSTDFRFLEPALLAPGQVVDHAPSGPVTGVIGLFIGHGSNYLNAIQAEGRLVLNNGSHRAYALREAGITHAPCVIQIVSRRDELSAITSGELEQHPQRYLDAPRPPMLKDYFDPALRRVWSVPRQLRQVIVSFGVQTIDVPAS